MTLEHKNDNVKHPSHYNQYSQEAIDTINEWLQPFENPFVAYCVGNTLKYLARCNFKGNLKEDLKKAREYLDYAVKELDLKDWNGEIREYGEV